MICRSFRAFIPVILLAVISGSVAAQSTPTQSDHPVYPYTIAGLAERSYPGGVVHVIRELDRNQFFTQSYIQYPSDGLNITGIMYTPVGGNGPFPVVVLLHGYYDRASYWSGLGTWQEAEFFARNGFIAIAPDFRGWGESESGISLFQTGPVIDTLNLISSLASIPDADPTQVTLFGHSMGGGATTKVLTSDPPVRAAVLYAPNSADDADLIRRWGVACLPGQSQSTGDHCNPSEYIPPNFPEADVQAYYAAASDPTLIREIAPIYHLDQITVPVQIHIGTADGASLAQTPPEWSERLAAALQQNGNEVEYFVYTDQGHFLTGESWLEMMNRSLTFFNQHLSTSN